MRLDRFLANLSRLSRTKARHLLATGEVRVDGQIIRDPLYGVTPFSHIEVMGRSVQRRQPRYFMLNKPAGYLSATTDPVHPTVLELLDEPDSGSLHIAGRLDRASTGLLLITDDGRWSGQLTAPDKAITKVYRVVTEDPIHPDTARSFAEGFFFEYEGITTKPVVLEQLGEREARLTLVEGRYHQIKRMFGRFRNRVLQIHRQQIGGIPLDSALSPGDYRPLNQAEIDNIFSDQSNQYPPFLPTPR